jgi:hypothetical protein
MGALGEPEIYGEPAATLATRFAARRSRRF